MTIRKLFLIAFFTLTLTATSKTQGWDPWPDCFPCPDDGPRSEAVSQP